MSGMTREDGTSVMVYGVDSGQDEREYDEMVLGMGRDEGKRKK